MQTNSKIRPLAVTAMLSAVGCILMMLDFTHPYADPRLLSRWICPSCPRCWRPSAWALSTALWSAWSRMCCPPSSTVPPCGIGEVCNFAMGAMFVGVAGLIYKHKKTRKNAVLASLIGSVAMAAFSVPVNFFFSYPVYAAAFGGMDADHRRLSGDAIPTSPTA